MSHLMNLLKGVVVGLGAVAPGLSGSILLVIFGLYQKIVSTVSHIFKGFKKNLLFLIPIALGIGVGMVLFSKLIDIPLTHFPMQTYYAFLGLILGTIPMVLKEVRKEGFHPKYYIFSGVAFAAGAAFFLLNQGLFPDVVDANIFQSLALGLAVAAAYLVPGVDSFAILSAFGLYNLWKDSLADLNFGVLIPAGVGLVIGGILISLIFNKLFAKWYTGTYSIIFGLFLAVILNYIVKECPPPALDLRTGISAVFFLLGLAFSLTFSQLERIMAKIRKQPTEEV